MKYTESDELYLWRRGREILSMTRDTLLGLVIVGDTRHGASFTPAQLITFLWEL